MPEDRKENLTRRPFGEKYEVVGERSFAKLNDLTLLALWLPSLLFVLWTLKHLKKEVLIIGRLMIEDQTLNIYP